jgi:membrane protein DedA with SNARE-associated domain
MSRRGALVLGGALVAFVVLAVVLNRAGSADGFGTVAPRTGTWAYAAVTILVVLDAICAIFPGETTVNAAATMAADGRLELWGVMLAAAVGAVGGDSALYWIARGTAGRFQRKVDAALANEKVALAMAYLGSSARVLLVAGRYVPGMRFVVNASLGASRYPYRRFLLWSAVGGTTWAVYTAALAYAVATTLAGFPLASIVISSAITSLVLVVVFVRLRRSHRHANGPATA